MTIEIFFIFQQHHLHRYPDRANNDPYIDQSISITTLHGKPVLKARDHVVCFAFDFGNKIKNFTLDDTNAGCLATKICSTDNEGESFCVKSWVIV